MKIDNINLNRHIYNNSNIKNINKEESKIILKNEDKNISFNIDKIKNSIIESNGIDYDKVNILKERIKNNNYQIDFQKLAINITKEEF